MRQAKYTSDAARLRSLPVTYDEVSHKSEVSVLEQYVTLWAPRDLRLDPEYQRTHEVVVTDDAFMQDIAKGMKIIVQERVPSKGMIKVAVLFQHNLSEFERYNDVVDKHNNSWIDKGCPEDTFDPVTGDIFEIKDKYINRAGDDSYNPLEGSGGSLSSARPTAKRKKLLTITYVLNRLPSSEKFELEYSAEDTKGNIVYFNKLVGANIAYLTRRATQELYGNPEVYGNSGPFYEGISMLITGKKIRYCAGINEKPKWSPDKIKNPVVDQAVVAAKSSGLKTMALIIKYSVPTVGILSILFKTFIALAQQSLEGLFVFYAVTLVSMYLSVIVSESMLRKSYSVTMEGKFL
jgi:hypothetical protein